VLHRDKVHPIHRSGRFFTVAGPLNIPPLPQRRPVQIQAGQSEAGRALGARYAEIVFTSLPTLDIALDFTRKIRRQAEQFGRADGLPLIFSAFHATYGATEDRVHGDSDPALTRRRFENDPVITLVAWRPLHVPQCLPPELARPLVVVHTQRDLFDRRHASTVGGS
jgi:alkanesulfonate monooxygenase SsuD/methylene tetrahydromethanopterin reductase-like flavin-dependent oxidoreductase (luciferase family)